LEALFIAGGDLSENAIAPFKKIWKSIYTKLDFADDPLVSRPSHEVDFEKAMIVCITYLLARWWFLIECIVGF
jgi:hypothetical protein